MQGLELLTRVSLSLRIAENPALESLDGLSALWSVGGAWPCWEGETCALVLESNDRLASLRGMGSLTDLEGQLRIERNGSLRSLEGLEGLRAVRHSLLISGNPALETLRGLDGLHTVRGELRIVGNPSLRSLDALDAVVLVRGDLVVEDNVALPTCEAEALCDRLSGLDFTGECRISGNDDAGRCE